MKAARAPADRRPAGRAAAVLSLQGVVAIYAAASASAKAASAYPAFSGGFLLFYALELLLLGIYALLWQQAVKRLPLSAAYANRSVAVFWGLLLSAAVFKERVTWQNLLGVGIIFAGVLLVNTEKEARR